MKGLAVLLLLGLAAAAVQCADSSTTLTPVPEVATSGDICTACVCQKDKKILNCKGKNLSHHFASQEAWDKIGFPVTEAHFDKNLLVRVFPWVKVDSLQKLTLTHNHISVIENRAFLNLTNIVELNLSHNRLTSDKFQPNIFEGHYAPDNYEPLQRLRVLRLGSNALHTLHPDIFEHLPNLEELHLDSNPFQVIDKNTHMAITTISYLKVLDLSRTGINILPDYFLHPPKFLTDLDLSGNQFVEPPAPLASAHGLLRLDLSENPFTEINTFPYLPNLTSLTISHCMSLKAIGPLALESLSSLTELKLFSNPRLSNLASTALAKAQQPPMEGHVWPPITVLHLHDNAIQYLESSLVGRWDTITELRLDGNPWKCDCENQWVIETLLPTMESKNPKFGDGLTCAAPIEMKGILLRQLQSKHSQMRCEDYYGNRPERDGKMLVAALIGVLIAVPVTLLAYALWRRRSCLPGRFGTSRGTSEYSRAFYKPAASDPDFI